MRRSPIFIVFLTIFIDMLGFGIIIPILPNYSAELGGSGIEVGLIASIYSLMNFTFSSAWGALSDRYGRRPIILTSILITAASYFMFAFSSTLILVFIARLIAGIGSANIATVQACVVDTSTHENRTRRMGIVGAAFGLGFIFGPPVGGMVKEHGEKINNFLAAIFPNTDAFTNNLIPGIEWVGIIAAALCIVNFLMAYFLLPETLKERNPDRVFRLNPFYDLKWAMKKEIIRDLFIINFFYITAFAAMQVTIPMLWKFHYHLTDAGVGYVFMFIGIASAIVQGGLIGWLNKNFGEKRLVLSGAVMMMIGLGLCPVASDALFIPVLAVIIILISLANGCITPTINSLISKNSPSIHQGQMLGLNMSFISLARVLGPAYGGYVYDFSYTLPYFIGAGIMLFAWVFALRVLNLKDSESNGNGNGVVKNVALDSVLVEVEADQSN